VKLPSEHYQRRLLLRLRYVISNCHSAWHDCACFVTTAKQRCTHSLAMHVISALLNYTSALKAALLIKCLRTHSQSWRPIYRWQPDHYYCVFRTHTKQWFQCVALKVQSNLSPTSRVCTNTMLLVCCLSWAGGYCSLLSQCEYSIHPCNTHTTLTMW